MKSFFKNFFDKQKIILKPFLKKICIYPIKSLPLVEVSEAKILSSGALEHDREFALFDEDGKFVHAKRSKEIHQIKAKFSNDFNSVNLSTEKISETKFELTENKFINEFFSEHFGFKIFLKQNVAQGFPDDTNSLGPTLVGENSLIEVANWIQKEQNISLSIDELIKRFRPNLIIGEIKAFWEDEFIQGGVIYVGDIMIQGDKATPRCVVPTRDPSNGEILSGFAKIITENRKKTISSNINKNYFEHYYKLCLNTKIPFSESSKILRLSDEIKTESEIWGDFV